MRVVKIEIKETEEELKSLLGQQKTAKGKERVQALYLLKTKQVETVQHLAVVLGRNRVTVQDWLREYREGGLEKLLEKRHAPGRPSVIPAEVVERLKKELSEPKGFSSYQEIQLWIKAEYGLEINYDTVHNLVRDKLKAKLKVARGRSREQDSEEVAEFRENLGEKILE